MSDDTAPTARNAASHRSTKPRICTTPRPSTTGPNRETTLRTPSILVLQAEAQVARAALSTDGSWTNTWPKLPMSTPQARAVASSAEVAPMSATATRAMIWPAFHSTGAT